MTAPSGKAAVDTANGYTHYEVGYCLKWVRTCWEIGSYFGSAIEAWNGAKHKHPGDRSAPVGAPLFYRGGNYGHIVISKPNASGMRSTDCRSSGVVSDEAISWVENHWGYEYLGWTEDLNGILLPLEGDDVALTQSDIDKIAEAVWNRAIKSRWDGTETKAAAMLSSTQYYAIEAGIISHEPDGGKYPGTRTTAGKIYDQIAAIDGA